MTVSWDLNYKSRYFSGNHNLESSEQLIDLLKGMRKFLKDNPGLEISGFDASFDSELGWNGTIAWWGGVL